MRPGGLTANYSYYPNLQDKRLQQIKNQTSTSVLLSQFDYTYDTEGQLQTWTKNYPSLPTPQRYDLGYDNADQLLTAPLRKTTNNALIRQYTYGYDLASNRTSELIGSTTTNSVPNNLNEITSQSGGSNRTLSYDLNGSLTSDGGNRTFEWDGTNRLVAVNYTATTQRTEFSYDGLNRCVKLVEKNGSTIASTRRFVYCGREKCEYRNANGSVQLQVFGQGQYQSDVPYFYFRDHLGSIREMTDASGAVVARYDYDPWGRSTTVIGTNKPDFNFAGLYNHAKSGLDMATYRFYDPDLGRWLNRDPSGESGGLNLYSYVLNNPPRNTDPLGLAVGDWWDLSANFNRARAIGLEELAKRPVAHNDIGDATRHAEWMRRTTQETNSFTAWVAGTGHEFKNEIVNLQPLSELLMDLHNNAAGREAGRNDTAIDLADLWTLPFDHLLDNLNAYSDDPYADLAEDEPLGSPCQ